MKGRCLTVRKATQNKTKMDKKGGISRDQLILLLVLLIALLAIISLYFVFQGHLLEGTDYIRSLLRSGF